ncbi:MAG TPA: NAD(P)H-binding protein, partial [Azospirillaceae bacterium]|nr:NAD(P)H-binding protein [Azospirillaceae bacterium]
MSGPMQTVAVFGATGFIGRHLIQHLTRKGLMVRAVTRVPNKAAFLRPAGGIGQVTPWAGDVGDDASVRRALAGVDMVVNLIGILYERGAASFQAVHVDAPARLARLAAEAGVKRFVHVSALGADA